MSVQKDREQQLSLLPEAGIRPAMTLPAKAIASLLGCSQRHVRRLAQDGVITGSDAQKRYPLSVVTDYIKYLKTNASGDLNKQRTRLAKEQADKTEIENGIRRGELVEVDAVHQSVGNAIQNAKSRLLSIPPTLAKYLENQSATDIESQLADAIHEALSELANKPFGE